MVEYKRLDEVCHLNMGQSPNSNSYNESGNGLPFFQGNADFGEMYPAVRVWCSEPTKIVDPGTLLISVRAPIGALNFADQRSCIGRGLAGITAGSGMNIKYVYYCLKCKNKELNAKGTGSTFKAISKNSLGETAVRIRTETEQIEITRILDSVTAIIAARKQQLAELDNLIKARFVEMFGDPANNPLSWTTNSLSRLLLIERGGSPRPIDAYITDSNDGVNWIKIGDAKPGSIYITRTKQKIKPEGSKKSRYVKPGDFILSNSMSFGRPYIMKIDGYIHDGWLLLRDEKGLFNNLFLHTMLSLDYTYNCFKSMAEGGVVNNLNKDLVGKLVVYIPPIDLQNQFASFVEQIDKSKVVEMKVLKVHRKRRQLRIRLP